MDKPFPILSLLMLIVVLVLAGMLGGWLCAGCFFASFLILGVTMLLTKKPKQQSRHRLPVIQTALHFKRPRRMPEPWDL